MPKAARCFNAGCFFYRPLPSSGSGVSKVMQVDPQAGPDLPKACLGCSSKRRGFKGAQTPLKTISDN